MKRFFFLVIANFKMAVRNWQALFWMFMFPLIIMSLLGIVFGGDSNQKARMGIVDNDRSKLSKSIVKSFDKIDSIDLSKGSEKNELKLIRNGKLDAVIVIKKGFSKSVPKPVIPKPVIPVIPQNATTGQMPLGGSQSTEAVQKPVVPAIPKITYEPKTPAKIELHYDPSQTFSSQMVRVSVKAIFSQVEKKMANSPELFEINETREAPKNMDFIDFLLPGIIGMAIMSNGIFGLSSIIVTYREKGILRRLKITPLPLSTFLGARIVTQVVISFFQTAVLIAFARFVFGVHITGSYFAIAVAVLVGSLCFINIGFLVSSIAKDTESADTIANIVNMPMMFLSGIFFPVDSVPAWVKPVIRILPLKFLADALRDITVRGKSLSAVQSNLYVLLGLTAVLFVLAIVFFRWESKAG